MHYWLPALLWLAVVAVFSSKAFAANNTGLLLLKALAFFNLKFSAPTMMLLHFAVRKSAHFVAYGVLSGLFFRAFRGPLPDTMWRLTWPLLALAVCFLTASADEIHQLYTPGRGGNYRDVVLDMAGALFVQLVILIVYIGKSGRRPR